MNYVFSLKYFEEVTHFGLPKYNSRNFSLMVMKENVMSIE